MRAVRFGWSVEDRRTVCIGPEMGLFGLVVEVAVGGTRRLFSGCCWEACLEVVLADLHMMVAFAGLEVILRSMTAEVCLAYWAGSHVVSWHTECYHSLMHWARHVRERRRLGVVSSLCVRSVLGR